MPLLDLSLVTQSLVSLVSTHISASDAWNNLNLLDVNPLPPDRSWKAKMHSGFISTMWLKKRKRKTHMFPESAIHPCGTSRWGCTCTI